MLLSPPYNCHHVACATGRAQRHGTVKDKPRIHKCEQRPSPRWSVRAALRPTTDSSWHAAGSARPSSAIDDALALRAYRLVRFRGTRSTGSTWTTVPTRTLHRCLVPRGQFIMMKTANIGTGVPHVRVMWSTDCLLGPGGALPNIRSGGSGLGPKPDRYSEYTASTVLYKLLYCPYNYGNVQKE